jgi:hypothetical protein
VDSCGLNASGGSCGTLVIVYRASPETNQLGGFMFIDP